MKTRPYGVGLWKNIRKGWRMFSSHIRFELRDGSKIILWDDVWCGEMGLEEAFLDLYSIVCYLIFSSIKANLLIK